MGFECGFDEGLMGFEGVRIWFDVVRCGLRGCWLTKTEKTSLLLFIAPPSLILVFCVPANVSELPFSSPQITNSLSTSYTISQTLLSPKFLRIDRTSNQQFLILLTSAIGVWKEVNLKSCRNHGNSGSLYVNI